MVDTRTSGFRWGIFGSGTMARRFAAGLTATEAPARVVRVASRRRENAEAFAAGIGARADSYEGLVAAGDVDAVYIATPAPAHEEHAVQCLEAGLPVLVEKPFALDAVAARRIVAAARASDTFAMEAMWTRFLPLIAELRELVDSGDIGQLRGFSGTFAIAGIPSPADPNFDPKLGGGALLQRGVYPLSLARHLLGPVADVSGHLRIGATGVDEDVMATARHEGGAVSQLHASLVTQGRNAITLYGTAGRVDVDGPIYRPFAFRLTTFTPRDGSRSGLRGGRRLAALRDNPLAHAAQQRVAAVRKMVLPGGRRIVRRYAGNGYGHEADAVRMAVEAGQPEHPLMPLDESGQVMELIDRLRAPNGSGGLDGEERD